MITIRPETPADYQAVFTIHRRAFGRDNEAELVEVLRRVAKPQISLVACCEASIVGHILFSPVSIQGSGSWGHALGLAPMAVAPEFQNQGIGSRLVDVGLATCRALGQTIVVVLGHPNYYPRFGFVPASHKGLRDVTPVPDEAFMVAELEPEALKGLTGVVRYLPEFSQV